MAKLINGNGNPAIYAAEDADLIASLGGNVTCIANVGNKYAATEEDATTIRLDDGVIITKEGRRIQLEAGESDTFYIPTGTSGQTNYYIIGYKLVQNADSTQVAEQFVQKMNSSSETITEDTFRSGATEVYVSVYRVTQVGFTIDSISGLLPELLDNASIKDNIDQINSDLGAKSVLPYPTFPFANNIAQIFANLESFKEPKYINNNLELDKTMFFSCDSIVPIKTGLSLERYSKGLFICSGTGTDVDGVLMAVTYSAHICIAYRNGSNWDTAYQFDLNKEEYTFLPSTYGNLYNNAKLTRFGNVIQLEIHGFKSLSGNYLNTIFSDRSIPSAYRPSSDVTFTREDPTGYKYRLKITPSGALTVYVYGTPSTAEQNNFIDFMTYII